MIAVEEKYSQQYIKNLMLSKLQYTILFYITVLIYTAYGELFFEEIFSCINLQMLWNSKQFSRVGWNANIPKCAFLPLLFRSNCDMFSIIPIILKWALSLLNLHILQIIFNECNSNNENFHYSKFLVSKISRVRLLI